MLTREELALEVFHILAGYENVAVDDVKQFCREVADLLSPPNVTKLALKAIVEQLRSCGYVCEGGPLELNVAFLALAELAEWCP